jgi:hypothetical protein
MASCHVQATIRRIRRPLHLAAPTNTCGAALGMFTKPFVFQGRLEQGPINFTDIHERDRLSATIVTEGAPRVMTQRQVEAALAGSAPGASSASAAAPARSGTSEAAAPTTGAAPAPAARRLPKTASALPLVGFIGATLLCLGLVLTARRRWLA